MVEFHFRPYERKSFDAEKCTRCGECLINCPVIHMKPDKAKKTMKILADGGSVPEVERACTSCFTCNQVCPNDCRPTNLFLDKWHAYYEKEGIPRKANWFLPLHVPNFRTYIIDRMPPDEKAAIEKWASLDPVPGGEVMFAGCNLITTPFLTFSKIFDGITIRGRLSHCCGEMYFRMGLYDQVAELAKRLSYYFKEQLQVKKVSLVCTAGANLLKNILPQFGADFRGITFEHYQQQILKNLENGTWKVTNPLSGTVTVQDSCHSKMFEPHFFDVARKILAIIGLQVIEAPQSKEAMLCCGIGDGFSHQSAYGKMSMIRGTRRALKNVKAAGADRVCALCPGCMECFAIAKKMTIGKPATFHLLELVQQALGETPRPRYDKLGSQFFAGAMLHQRGSKPTKIPPIPERVTD